jgi:cyclic pyranopterin monophosphate synthase
LAASKLTHLDRDHRPRMVDIGSKKVTARTAVAQAIVRLPASVSATLKRSGHRTRKGPVFDTAIIAGVMAAKRTHELIPFCHPLALSDCAIDISWQNAEQLIVQCNVSVKNRTGVEMEALTGASVAALTIYDMCKALSHDIQIHSVRLMTKTGGKRDFKRKK